MENIGMIIEARQKSSDVAMHPPPPLHREIKEEEFLEQVTKSEKVVCHFYHNDFERCKIFDKVTCSLTPCCWVPPVKVPCLLTQHLSLIAPKCVGTKFIKLNAEKAPFFVSKLKARQFSAPMHCRSITPFLAWLVTDPNPSNAGVLREWCGQGQTIRVP